MIIYSQWATGGVNECRDFLSLLFRAKGLTLQKKKITERSLPRELANANSRREYEKINYNFNHTTPHNKLSKIYLLSINKNFKRAHKQVNLHLFKWHYISSPSNAINYYNEHESSKNASKKNLIKQQALQ